MPSGQMVIDGKIEDMFINFKGEGVENEGFDDAKKQVNDIYIVI